MANKQCIVPLVTSASLVTSSAHVSYYIADTDAGKPVTGLNVGDLCWAVDTLTMYVATSATTMEALVRAKRVAVNNVNYTAVKSDYIIAYTGMSATRTITLPTAASCGSGKMFIVKDEGGSIGGAISLIIDPAGAETIDGFSTYSLTTVSQSVWIYTNGSNWFTA